MSPAISSVSYSAISAFDLCPQKFKFHYLDGLGQVYRQDRPFLSLGESIHQTLARFFRLEPAQRSPEQLQRILSQCWVSRGYDSPDQEQEYRMTAHQMLKRLWETQDMQARPIYLEEFFRVPYGDFTLVGKIDRVDKHRDGSYEIVDYKTGRIVPPRDQLERDLQVRLYALGCWKKFGFRPSRVSLWYLQPAEKLTVEISGSDLEATEAELRRKVEEIRRTTAWEPRPGPYCRYCDYQAICPAMGLGLRPTGRADAQEALQETIRHLESIRNDLFNLHRASSELSGILDPDRLTRKLLDLFLDLSRSEKGVIFLRDEAGTLTAVLQRGAPAAAGKTLPPSEWRPALVKEGEPAARAIPEALGAREALVLPLLVREQEEDGMREQVIGLLALAGRRGGTYQEYDRIFLTTLADQAAVFLQNARLYELAITDGLTRLFLHRYFQQRLEAEMARARRYNSNLSLILTDIDHFKKVNDTYGHQAGDFVLRGVAQILRQHIRTTDIAARYGGEEFAIILPETGAGGAQQVAENLRLLVEKQRYEFDGKTIPTRISCGVAAWDRTCSKEEFIEQADQALYEAKQTGRNRVVVHGL